MSSISTKILIGRRYEIKVEVLGIIPILFDKKGRYQLVKGGRNQEGYADPTATIAVGRVAKEERE